MVELGQWAWTSAVGRKRAQAMGAFGREPVGCGKAVHNEPAAVLGLVQQPRVRVEAEA
jgi:hypothetical protein